MNYKHLKYFMQVARAGGVTRASEQLQLTPQTVSGQIQLLDPVHMVCREWSLDKLLTELALHRLDLVISDSPIPSTVSVRAFSHRLGTSGAPRRPDARSQGHRSLRQAIR